MKFRGLDADGDWQLGQGIGSYAQDAAALALDIAARIRSRKGGCFFAPTDGVDYTNLMEKGQKANLITALSNTVMQTPGVVKINSVDANFDPRTRGLTMTYNIQTIFTRSFQATINNITGAPN